MSKPTKHILITLTFTALLTLLLTPSLAADTPDDAPKKINIQDIDIPTHSATIPTKSPKDWWLRYHNRYNDLAKQGNIDLLFIGDSITNNWTDAGRDVYKQFYAHRNVAHFGVNSDTTQNVLWRLDHTDYSNLKPKLVILMIGTNNSGSNTSTEIAQGITAIAQRIRKYMPQSKLLILGIFPRGEKPTNPLRLVNVGTNSIIKYLHNNDMIHYLDIGDAFLTKDGILTKQISPDSVHLTPRGYSLWANAIEPKVIQLMNEN